MAEVKFEGDLEQLSPRQLKYISEVLSSKGFRDAKVTIDTVGEAGDNYVANVKRVTVDNNGEIFKMIIKVAPKIELLRMMMNARTYFLNEHVMYTEILPKYTELEKAAGIPAEERLRYAICYGTLTEDCDELIILEDLTDSGFTMLDRFEPLTDEEIRLVLKNFAKLHSLSYALKYQEPDTFNSLTSKIVDFPQIFPMEEQLNQYMTLIEQDCIAICDPKYHRYIKGNVSGMLETGKKLNNFDKHSRFSVIQQGDAWTNNILFKLQEGKSVSCCMIDYQLSRLNSPVADLHYMIFYCSNHETRKQHYVDWIDYYHSELEKNLYEFGHKVNYVYPRDQLDADLKRHAKGSVGMAVLLAATLGKENASAQEFKTMMETMSPENILEMMEATKASKFNEKTLTIFKNRVEGIIETSLNFGLLGNSIV